MTQAKTKQSKEIKKNEHKASERHHLKPSAVVMTLHTWEAESLFQGRWQHGFYGFSQYAKTMSKIWQAYKEEDPYAESILIDLQKRLIEIQEKFSHIQKILDKKLSNLHGFNVVLPENERPTQKALYQMTPFGFMGAYILRDLDLILRTALTLKQLGIILKENFDVKNMIIELRKLYEYPSSSWRYTGVTREDIRQNNPKAQQAKNWLGDINHDVLNKKVQFQFN